MFTKAEIQSINFTSNTCTIRVPFFENAASDAPVIVEAQIMCLPGIYNGYVPGDMVWVEFENGLMDRPVVTGKVYTGVKSEKNCEGGALQGTTLEVTGSAILSDNTTFKGLETQYNSVKKIQDTLKNLSVTAANNTFATTVDATFQEQYITAYNSELTTITDFKDVARPCQIYDQSNSNLSKIVDKDAGKTKWLIDNKFNSDTHNNRSFILINSLSMSGLNLYDNLYDYNIELGKCDVKYYKNGTEVEIKSADDGLQLARLRVGIGYNYFNSSRQINEQIGVIYNPRVEYRIHSPYFNLTTGVIEPSTIFLLTDGDFTKYRILRPTPSYQYSWDGFKGQGDTTSEYVSNVLSHINRIKYIVLYTTFSENDVYDEIKVEVDYIKLVKCKEPVQVQLNLTTNNYYATALQRSSAETFVNNLQTVQKANLPIIFTAKSDITYYNEKTSASETIAADSQYSALLTITGTTVAVTDDSILPIVNVGTTDNTVYVLKHAIPVDIDTWSIDGVMTNKL